MSDRPNIIYIVAHDLGRMLGCYGRGFKSPNLDRFASQGALFNKTFCTTTACSPSRGCAWTGQYAHTNGLMGLVNRGWSLPVERRKVDELVGNIREFVEEIQTVKGENETLLTSNMAGIRKEMTEVQSQGKAALAYQGPRPTELAKSGAKFIDRVSG